MKLKFCLIQTALVIRNDTGYLSLQGAESTGCTN